MKMHYFLFFIFIIFFIRCEDDPSLKGNEDIFSINMEDTSLHVLESNWRFLGLENTVTNEKIRVPNDQSILSLIIHPLNTYHVINELDTIEGHYFKQVDSTLLLDNNYFLEDHSLHFNATWESNFLEYLDRTERYIITGDILTLITDTIFNLKFRFSDQIESDVKSCFDFENNFLDVDIFRDWIFLGYLKDGTDYCQPEMLRQMNINLTNKDSIYGYSAFNEIYKGNYTLIDIDSIRFNIRATASLSSNDTIVDWDINYINAISYTNVYDIQGIKLFLKSSLDGKTLIFKAADY